MGCNMPGTVSLRLPFSAFCPSVRRGAALGDGLDDVELLPRPALRVVLRGLVMSGTVVLRMCDALRLGHGAQYRVSKVPQGWLGDCRGETLPRFQVCCAAGRFETLSRRHLENRDWTWDDASADANGIGIREIGTWSVKAELRIVVCLRSERLVLSLA